MVTIEKSEVKQKTRCLGGIFAIATALAGNLE